MATTCSNNDLYLYYPNGTFTRKNITTPASPRYIGYDSSGRFVQISWTQINIYNKIWSEQNEYLKFHNVYK